MFFPVRAGAAALLCLLLVLGTRVAAQTSPWQYAGPAALNNAADNGAVVAGPISALAAGAGGAIFTGGAGGVWLFQNQRWTAMDAGAPVSALTSAGGVLYAGQGWLASASPRAGGGIFSSSDGVHWSPVGGSVLAGLTVTRIVADGKGNLIWAAAVLGRDSPAGRVAGLYAYDPSQAEWTLALPGDVWDVAWDPRTGASLAVTSTGLAWSAGAGVGFTRLTQETGRGRVELNPAGGFYVLWSSSSGPSSLLAVAANGSLGPPVTLPATIGAVAPHLAIAASSTGSGATIWVGGTGLWTSSDGGQSWNLAAANGVVGERQHVILPLAGGTVWVGNDQGVWEETSPGAWNDENATLTNLAPQGLVFTATGALGSFAGDGLARGSLATAGVSSAWSVTGAAAADFGGARLASGTGAIYAAPVDSAQLLISTDGGTSWTLGGSLLGGPSATPAITALTAAGAGVWVGGSDGELDVSSDGGVTLQALLSPTGGGAISGLAAAAPATAGAGARLWVASGTTVWASSDGGGSWAPMPPPGGEVTALTASALAPGAEVAAATTTGVFVWQTTTGSWFGLPAWSVAVPVGALTIDSSNRLWLAALGRGLWQTPLGPVGLTVSLQAQPGTVAAGQALALEVTTTAAQQPIANASVIFSASEDGHSVPPPAAVTTGVDGTASVSGYLVPQTAGTLTIQALAASGSASASTVTSVPVGAGSAASLRLMAGSGQSEPGGSTLDLTFEADDAFGNPVAAQTLTFSGDGAFSPASVTTGVDGRAQVAYTFPALAGTQPQTLTLAASDANAPSPVEVQWEETALPPPGYTLVVSPVPPVPPNQNYATLTVQVIPSGGYNQTVPLLCSPDCSLAAASVAPPYAPVTARITIPVSATAASDAVTIASDSAHSVDVQVPLQGFTLNPVASNLRITSTGTGPALQVSVTPINGFTAAVALQATGLPPGWQAQFQPPSIAVGASGGASQFRLAPVSSAAMTGVVRAAGRRAGPEAALGLGLWWSMALLAACCRRRRRPGRTSRSWSWIGLGTLALLLAGCGGGGAAMVSSDPPPTVTSYQVQLIATSGRLQTSVPVTVSLVAP